VDLGDVATSQLLVGDAREMMLRSGSLVRQFRFGRAAAVVTRAGRNYEQVAVIWEPIDDVAARRADRTSALMLGAAYELKTADLQSATRLMNRATGATTQFNARIVELTEEIAAGNGPEAC
jgi:hypothetical protein